MTILRINRLIEINGCSRSKFYKDVAAGLMVQPVKLGARFAGVPAQEAEAIMTARIGGASDTEVRALVKRLHAQRAEASRSVLAGA